MPREIPFFAKYKFLSCQTYGFVSTAVNQINQWNAMLNFEAHVSSITDTLNSYISDSKPIMSFATIPSTN